MPEIDKVSVHQEICSIDNERNYRHIILGHQFGIGLRQRGPNDPHVCFVILSEDDGHWFATRGGASTSWLDDLKSVIERAEKWCKSNCAPDMCPANPNVNGSPLRQYGWKFHTGA